MRSVKVAAYTHNINRPMMIGFIRLVKCYLKTKKPVNMNKDLGLDHNQKCNVPKLQYYDLIKNIEGLGWVPTKLGIDFCQNKTKVLSPAATIENDVLPDSHPAWETHTKKRKMVGVYDILGFDYKKRPEYQAEKSAQDALFNNLK